MSDRALRRNAFLQRVGWSDAKVLKLAGDASARRYFRLTKRDGAQAILMDAPTADGQTVAPFVAVAKLLRGFGLNPPQIYEADRQNGFLLLEDFGDALFADVIRQDPASETTLYSAAVDVLVDLAQKAPPSDLPVFTPVLMGEMIEPVFDWYCMGVTGDVQDAAPLQAMLTDALESISFQCLSLRDYHAENLIWLPERRGTKSVGLLDFQDAMIGPVGYDLVSLLQDARRDVGQETKIAMIERFCIALGLNRDDFAYSYAVVGLQRNLRILGIFARLAMKLDRPRYLDFIPRVWRYVEASLLHPELGSIADRVYADIPRPTPQRIERLRTLCGHQNSRS